MIIKNTYKIKVSFETEFEIKAISKDVAETIAVREFWKEPEKAELLGLEVENYD